MSNLNISEHLTDKALRKRKSELVESRKATKKCIETLSDKMDRYGHDAGQYEGIMSMIRELYPRMRGLDEEIADIENLLAMPLEQRLNKNNTADS